MNFTWTESSEAGLAEQNWKRLEQERHQRLLHQLKTELRQFRERERSPITPTAMATKSPPSGISSDPAATAPESVEVPVAQDRGGRGLSNPKKVLPPVQIR